MNRSRNGNMHGLSRRTFLAAMGAGVFAGAVGVSLAEEMALLRGLGPDEGPIDFGAHEELVALMQDTDADALLPILARRHAAGTSLSTLVAAGALANARTFGGQDYVGYHCFMALLPALDMARRSPAAEAALPVWKVLHRNTTRIRKRGGRTREVLRTVAPPEPGSGSAAALHAAARRGDAVAAETALATLTQRDAKGAFEDLQPVVRDNIDVHQVVLAWRAWDMLEVAGPDNAYVMMRQALRQCVQRDEARRQRGRPEPSLRRLLPTLVEKHGLAAAPAGTKTLDDAAFAELVDCLWRCGRDDAADLAATTLARGVAREQVGEALSAAAACLLLHDPGLRTAAPGKPVGSVHGASIGVHAADAAHAWRGIASACGDAEANASLIAAAWHTAGQSGRVDVARTFHAGATAEAAKVPADKLLGALREAVTGRDQALAAALVERGGALDLEPDAVIAAVLPFAVSQEGALHHEKYFTTATTEFARTRPAFRWHHLTALARVNASGYGFESPGYTRARDLTAD